MTVLLLLASLAYAEPCPDGAICLEEIPTKEPVDLAPVVELGEPVDIDPALRAPYWYEPFTDRAIWAASAIVGEDHEEEGGLFGLFLASAALLHRGWLLTWSHAIAPLWSRAIAPLWGALLVAVGWREEEEEVTADSETRMEAITAKQATDIRRQNRLLKQRNDALEQANKQQLTAFAQERAKMAAQHTQAQKQIAALAALERQLLNDALTASGHRGATASEAV